MKKIIKNLADILSIDAEILAKAISSEEEVDIELPKGKFHRDEDIESMKKTFELDKTQAYEDGKKAGIEIPTKTFSRAAGLGTIKSPEEFVDAFRKKIIEESTAEPDKKILEYEQSVENLRVQLDESQNRFKTLEFDLKQKEIDNKIANKIPDTVIKYGLSKDEVIHLYRMGRKITDEGIFVGDKILKDQYERPISIEKDIESFISTKGWVDKPQGRGGIGETDTPKTFSEYEKAVKDRGLTPGSVEANQLLHSMAKENPEILN